ncbi:ATP-binding protein [Pseudofrankia sp. BMG5.36]|uniref:MacS family sensor histidine kinase n=1 Tax=Pseudofrankia sp. BMG5.36 TaxID=1834512 RepID=UPI000AC575C0|nr:ATP-binding protein [Pseudofrankia sp. BMG5.36]
MATGAHDAASPVAPMARWWPRASRTWRARPPRMMGGSGPEGARGALWRSLAVFRWVSVGYASAAAGARLDDAYRPALGIGLLGVMVGWSAALTVLVPRADRGDRPHLLRGLVLADVAVCAGLVVGAELVGPRTSHALPMMWATSGVFGAALLWGAAGGIASGLLVAVVFIAEWGALTDALVGTSMLLLVSGAVAGHLSRTTLRAEAALADALEARAGDAERERLARRVHDGVLQVLALIAREAPRGMPAEDVARLAAEQESTLRDLLRTPGSGGPRATARGAPPEAPSGSGRPGRPGGPDVRVSRGGAARTDLAEALLALAHSITTRLAGDQPAAADRPAAAALPTVAEPGIGEPPAAGPAAGEPAAGQSAWRMAVTVATPGVPVLLRADRAAEVVAAVRAALDNVARHAGTGASAWVLLEDDGDEVVVTVRDDGVGLAPGRAERAAAEGRLGLAVSIRGRIRDLGGEVAVLGRPGQGTEVELHVPR